MRKRDALKIALRSLRLPKLSESDKLFWIGFIISLASMLLSLALILLTRNIAWISVLVVGCFIGAWFNKASEIMDEWEWKMMLEIERELGENEC